MFTGIIESLGVVDGLEKDGSNLHIRIKSAMAGELKIDQSVSHNGVCLTVVAVDDQTYTVTAIEETLQKSNLDKLEIGSHVNLERAMVMGSRLDGHLVQGHVDSTGRCTQIEQLDGSWYFHFKYDSDPSYLTVEKGSISVDGVSLTVVDSGPDSFSVAIIPFTYEHTRFKDYKVGTEVNLEFDVIGKYVARLLNARL